MLLELLLLGVLNVLRGMRGLTQLLRSAWQGGERAGAERGVSVIIEGWVIHRTRSESLGGRTAVRLGGCGLGGG
jgi:hypothetical protein